MFRVPLLCSIVSALVGAIVASAIVAVASERANAQVASQPTNGQVDPQRVVVRELVVVDDEGRERARLATRLSGNAILSFVDPDREVLNRMSIGQLDEGTWGYFMPTPSIFNQTRPGQQSSLMLDAEGGLAVLGVGRTPGDAPDLHLIDRATGREVEIGFDGERMPKIELRDGGSVIWSARREPRRGWEISSTPGWGTS